jgi:hypothetical protein
LPASEVAVPTLAPTRTRAVALAASLFIFFFAAYAFTLSADIFSTGDTTIRIQLAENIIEHHAVSLQGWSIQYAHHTKKEYFDPRVHVGRSGNTYATYELGQPIAIIPFELFAKSIARHERWPQGAAQLWFDRLVGPLFGALEALIFFLFAVKIGFGVGRSVVLTLIFGFATMAWPDEQSVLEHTEVAFFLLLGTYFAFRFREHRAGQRYLIFSGMGIGGAMITRYQDAFIAAIVIAFYLCLPGDERWDLGNRFRRVAMFGLGLFPFIAIDMWFSWVRFSSVTATGHDETLFGYPPWIGAPGLIVSPGKGLVWYCPTIFLLVFAGRAFYRRYGALSLAIIAMVAGFVALYSNVTFWHGDPAWGPRYMYPVVPFLTLPLGELLQHRFRRQTLVLAISALVVLGSFSIQFAAISVSPWRTWYRVIAYEENQGYKWAWIASRYRYFWNVHESPLNFQIHGLYQMAYDTAFHSSKYDIVPPNEDPILDSLSTDYAINSWNFWWASNEFNWWMGEDKIALVAIMLLCAMGATGTYVAAESGGIFDRESPAESSDVDVPEAA